MALGPTLHKPLPARKIQTLHIVFNCDNLDQTILDCFSIECHLIKSAFVHDFNENIPETVGVSVFQFHASQKHLDQTQSAIEQAAFLPWKELVSWDVWGGEIVCLGNAVLQ